MVWRQAYGGKRHGLAGDSSLTEAAQTAAEKLFAWGYGESFVVARLEPRFPLEPITRDTVRTIRLRVEGRTHGTTVKERERRRLTLTQERTMILSALEHVMGCAITDCRHRLHEQARDLTDV